MGIGASHHHLTGLQRLAQAVQHLRRKLRQLVQEKDAAVGKPTYPALYGIDGSRTLAREGTERAVAALDAVGIDAWWLRGFARWVLHRDC